MRQHCGVCTLRQKSKALRRALVLVLLSMVVPVIASCSNQNESKPPVANAPSQTDVKPNPQLNKKYDDAAWHYSGDFPKELPQKAGATHIGMFVAWAYLSGLYSEDFASDVEPLKSRKMTPGQFIIEQFDEVFLSEMLNDEGNRFTAAYFVPEDSNFLKDYGATLEGNLPSLYHVKDTWENFDKIKLVFDRRLAEFRKSAR